MPEALTLPGFGAINGKLYIAGGSGDAGYLDTLYIYDIATHSWTTRSESATAYRTARQQRVKRTTLSIWRKVTRFDADQHYPNLRPSHQHLGSQRSAAERAFDLVRTGQRSAMTASWLPAD